MCGLLAWSPTSTMPPVPTLAEGFPQSQSVAMALVSAVKVEPMTCVQVVLLPASQQQAWLRTFIRKATAWACRKTLMKWPSVPSESVPAGPRVGPSKCKARRPPF